MHQVGCADSRLWLKSHDNTICKILLIVNRFKICEIMSQVEKRKKVEFLYRKGVRDVKKLVQLTELGKSAVYETIKRIKNGADMRHRPVSGRPRKIRGNNLNALVNLGRQNPRLGFRKLANRFGNTRRIKVCPETVRMSLKRQGYIARKPKKIPAMTPLQRQRRIDFCQRFREDNFRNVFISDESCFQLGSNQLKILSRENVTVQISKFPTKIMVWGAISQRGATPLCIVDSTVNSAKYCDILNGFLLETAHALYPDRWRFQQDNATCHTSAYTQAWMHEHQLATIPWPAASPDLSPIENIWGLMKIEVERAAPRNKPDLIRSVLQAWTTITEHYGGDLVAGVPARLVK